MPKRLSPKLLNSLQLRELWVVFFVFGVILVNFPFLRVFNKTDMLFGFPLLFTYFFIGWGISIFIIYLFAQAIKSSDAKQTEKHLP